MQVYFLTKLVTFALSTKCKFCFLKQCKFLILVDINQCILYMKCLSPKLSGQYNTQFSFSICLSLVIVFIFRFTKPKIHWIFWSILIKATRLMYLLHFGIHIINFILGTKQHLKTPVQILKIHLYGYLCPIYPHHLLNLA